MRKTSRHRAALGLALGLALAGCGAWSAAETGGGRCGPGAFQGGWIATDRGDERFSVSTGEVVVRAGPVATRLVLDPERDVGERRLAEVAAEMRQVPATYPTALAGLGGPATRLCVLRVATPGGSLALLRTRDGLLRIEESRSDPPVVQRLHRAETPPSSRPVLDYSQPPR